MAQASWPSAAHNARAVNDIEYEQLIGAWAAEGVVGSTTDTPVVYGDGSGLQVKVRANRYALLRGHTWTSGSSDLILAIGANTSGAVRWDLVVVGLDRTTWDATVYVKPGGGVSSASLQRDPGTTGKWEIPLAQVRVDNGASSIVAGNVVSLAYFVAPPAVVINPTVQTWVPNLPGRDLMAPTTGNVWMQTGTGLTQVNGGGSTLVASTLVTNGNPYSNDYVSKDVAAVSTTMVAGHSYEAAVDCTVGTGDPACESTPFDVQVLMYVNGAVVATSGQIWLRHVGYSYRLSMRAPIHGIVGNGIVKIRAGRWNGSARFDVQGTTAAPFWLRIYDLGTAAV